MVEDAPRLANWIAEGLRDQGIAVDIAYDGNEGARRLHLNPYDVVVLDRDLPGIHGDTLCKMITESDEPAMILMLTAAGSPHERVTGLALGADDYLPKPFHFPELVLRVRGARPSQADSRQPQAPSGGNRTRPGDGKGHSRWPHDHADGKRTRRARSPPQSQPGRPQRREAARAGLGRERRPVHEHCSGHHRQAAPQTGRAPGHPNDARYRIPDCTCRERTGCTARRLDVSAGALTGRGGRLRRVFASRGRGAIRRFL